MKNFIFFLIILFIFSLSYEYEQYYERTIRRTEIIHVMLDMNSNSNTVKDYIIKNINNKYNGYVSETLSYNSNTNGNINNYLKESDNNLLAIYFYGGEREARNNYYDYINLRWQGRGSSQMYCFWKSSDSMKTLQHNNIIKISHFLDTNIIFSIISGEIKKIIIEGVTAKLEKELSLEKREKQIIHEIMDKIEFTRLIKKIFEIITKMKNNEEVMENVSDIIDTIEDISMYSIDFIENIPFVGEFGKTGLEVLKTVQRITNFPAELLSEITGNIFDKNNYKEMNYPEDVYDNAFTLIEGIGDGIQKTTVNTVKNIGHGVKDSINMISDNEIINDIAEGCEEAFDIVADGIDEALDFVGDGFHEVRDFFKGLFFE